MRASPYRLRFELSGSGSYISMFAQAFDRARSLARAAVAEGNVQAIVQAYDGWSAPWGTSRYGRRRKDSYAALAKIGVETRPFVESWTGVSHPDADPDHLVPHRLLSIDWQAADILIWNNIGKEIAVRPVAPVHTLLMDTARTILVDIYDDRGMDVSAHDPARLAALYRSHDTWLLDHDRERMTDLFA